MAKPFELQSFVNKFVNLWKDGCDASLHVEARAGNAFVSLRVGLGEAPPHPPPYHHGYRHRDGGPSPSRQRRTEKREASRKSAENAANDSKAGEALSGTENIPEKSAEEAEDSSVEKDEATIEVTGSPIPQVDGNIDDDVTFELKVEAHEECSNDDIIEAIETNFYGTFDDQNKEENESFRSILIKNSDEEKVFKVIVKDSKLAMEIIESWKIRYNFDELAFENYNFQGKSIRILEVRRL